MSKGSPIIPVRFPPELLRQIETQIAMTALFSIEPEAARGEWIRRACEEKLAKMRRSRRPRRRKRSPYEEGNNGHVQAGS